ncbi:MAG: aminopeptidase N [Maricaulaceae bacterium]
MRTETALKPTLLADYVPPNFDIDSVYLDFDLEPDETTVRSTLRVTRKAAGPLILNGEDIALKSVSIDGKALKRSQYRLTQKALELGGIGDTAVIEITNTCAPEKNSTLMGLYVSGGRFCTQCEAEGFRRITYYPDRPDVLSVFKVRISADKKAYPYLLANGNCVETGELGGARHFAIWEDPFPKPCYLFALVAGEFDILEDSFTTMSNRDIPLTIYVDPGDATRAEYAMDALKRSMRWDETAFGREYDLDRFMIVAVRDFNFGAMENKGLNIFNSALLLADGESATDMNFERIESVVAHEYFHNWTGNRITCRDWFQLCLKEGFTVFRDQEFSAGQRGAAVQRIKDVRTLRTRQFPEDAGPLVHPVRPDSYVKIDNFYTSTIYEKGAELIRMLKTLLGDDIFRMGCDYYFDTLDGKAATVEQFLACFEHISGKDLTHFMGWYTQAGTPHVTALREGNILRLTQSTPAAPLQKPQAIPMRMQFISDSGAQNKSDIYIFDQKTLEIGLQNLGTSITPSLFQGFSAPIKLKTDYTAADHLRLMAHDTDAFNRWEAGQTLARQLLISMADHIESGETPEPQTLLRQYTHALRQMLNSAELEHGFIALALTPPSDMEIIYERESSDPIAVKLAGEWLRRAISDHLKDDLLRTYHALATKEPFSPDADAAGRRALRNRCLALLASGLHPQAASLALEQLHSANNMTDELAGLITLTRLGGRRIDKSMQDFYEKWQHNPLVIDKWFAIQGGRNFPDGCTDISALTDHPAYDSRNPNRVRALIGNFAMNNPEVFHAANGSGYAFYAQQVLDMDSRNPSVAARLAGALEIRSRLDKHRQDQIKTELEMILASKPSANVGEIVGKILNSG